MKIVYLEWFLNNQYKYWIDICNSYLIIWFILWKKWVFFSQDISEHFVKELMLLIVDR